MKAIIDIIANIFRWLAARSEFAATPAGQVAAKKAETAQQEKKIEQGSAAVKNGDTDAVNSRIKRLTRTLALAVILGLNSGCLSKVCYVAESDKAVRVKAGENVTSKVDSWLVPDGVFALLLEKAERYQNMKEKAQ